MTCKKCGRDSGHYIGCPAVSAAVMAVAESHTDDSADQCAKDGCSKPRAASKGPRPAKYCDDHKTRSK